MISLCNVMGIEVEIYNYLLEINSLRISSQIWVYRCVVFEGLVSGTLLAETLCLFPLIHIQTILPIIIFLVPNS